MSARSEMVPLKSGLVKVGYSPISSVEAIEIDNSNSFGATSTKKIRFASNVSNWYMGYFAVIFGIFLCTLYINSDASVKPPIERAAWSSVAQPFSTVNPAELNFTVVDRPFSSRPGLIFAGIDPTIPLPTNSWYENLFLGAPNNTLLENNVFQVPYIIDTSGFIQGIRTHPAHVQANDRTVMMTYEPENGVSLGAVEAFSPQHYVRSQGTPAISKLGIEIEWLSALDVIKTTSTTQTYTGPSMRSPIVRGAPYTSMIYLQSTPRLFAQREIKGDIIIDNDHSKKRSVLICGQGFGNFSAKPVTVQKEIRFELDTSDMTWLLFVSEPTTFECSSQPAGPGPGTSLAPGVVGPPVAVTDGAIFELRATSPMRRGMVRLAMSNNCTTGQNPQYCEKQQPRDQSSYEKLLRNHADIYPTAKSDIQFTFPIESQEEEELRLILDWKPASMARIANETDDLSNEYTETIGVQDDSPVGGVPEFELLMVALPHHQERVRPIVGSSNQVLDLGCGPTIHGKTCPIIGRTWSMVEHLHRVNFSAPRPVRDELLPALRSALKDDLTYELPANYLAGAGDTYFSGKMLAKQARVLIIADEVGGTDPDVFASALTRLRQGVEVWLNGSSESPFLYDQAWGGMVMCGCMYIYENGVGSCANKFPDCPALTDAGQNFGAGFYNDHHYHYGYHIYAAAVVSKFDPEWGRRFHQHVLMLVRDIANPSDSDGFFPTWRHKDWYLGFSWASGIVTISGKPYPNGRNQESSSEAIAAYEAVALYGGVMADIFQNASLSSTTSTEVGMGGTDVVSAEGALFESASRVRDMGRLLAATEIRSAITYWHVQEPGAAGVSRIYPDIYAPKVVGMMWSMLAQEQTWFGNEPWKSYGIQLMPITPVSEQRDTVGWLQEMLPIFNQSCSTNAVCANEGWSILVSACYATVGEWQLAAQQVQSLPPDAFLAAGGNGHSLSNTLWYISTRPDVVPGNITRYLRN